jgi:hypothetical protein
VRAANQQSISEGLAERIRTLTAGLAELSEYVQRVTRDAAQEMRTRAIEDDSSTKPIQFLTENGFSIVRPWEAGGSSPPSGGSFHFLVCDPDNKKREVTVNVACDLVAEIAFTTRGRIEGSSSFWICCAERHLADYVTEHDGCPDADRLSLESLDCDEMMLALRWEKSDF